MSVIFVWDWNDILNRPSIFEWFFYDAQWFSQIFTDCHWLSGDFQWFIFVRSPLSSCSSRCFVCNGLVTWIISSYVEVGRTQCICTLHLYTYSCTLLVATDEECRGVWGRLRLYRATGECILTHYGKDMHALSMWLSRGQPLALGCGP